MDSICYRPLLLTKGSTDVLFEFGTSLVGNCEPLARWVYFMTASYVLIVPVKNHAEKIYIW